MPASPRQNPVAKPAAPSPRATLDALVAAAVGAVSARLGTTAERLAAALSDVSAPGMEAKDVYRRVKSGKLLKDNAYAFCHLAGDSVHAALRRELERLAPAAASRPAGQDGLSLVPLDEIDSKLALAALARPFDIAHAEALAVLAVRLGLFLKRGTLRGDAHPFRPDVFLQAIVDAWRAFEPDADAHGLIEPLLRPDLLFDFAPVYDAVVQTLASKAGQADAADRLRFQKTDDGAAARAARAASRAALADRLRKLFGDDGGDDGVPLIPDVPGLPAGQGGWRPSTATGFAPSPVPPAPGLHAADGDGGQAPGVPLSDARHGRAGQAAGVFAPTGAAPAHAHAPVAPGPQPAGNASAHGVAASSGGQVDPGAEGALHDVPGASRAQGSVTPASGAVASTGRPARTPAPSSHAVSPTGAVAAGAPHPASVAAPGGGAGAHNPLDAVLAGVRPGVVAPLIDLLARLGTAHGLPAAATTPAPGTVGQAAGPVDAGAAPGPDAAAAGDPARIVVPHDVFYLPRLRQRLPQGSLSRGDARTLDLLSRVFETVLLDGAIPAPTRALLQLLQVPVLKAALADRDFFYEQAHPARRLIDLMSRMGWEQHADGAGDAASMTALAAMRRSVAHVMDRAGGADGDGAGNAGFAAAVAELQAGLDAADRALDDAIAAPVAGALRQERLSTATRAAREAVALRIQAGALGEMEAVVGAFLEQRWTTVMTFAYSIEADKPGAVGNAMRAMDDLIWSVKPKPTQEQRKTLIGRLPRLLGTLNKWLDAIKWQEAERLQFFARLAEYHASIVRAPIELAPERQLELAVEAAQQDALRRVELEEALAAAAAERAARERAALSPLDGLERGSWLEFRDADGPRKVKLAWVSPLRTLFIFSGAGRKEAFSLPAEKLAAALHAGTARVLAVDGVVGQVLSEAMASGAVNDASMLAAASRAAAG